LRGRQSFGCRFDFQGRQGAPRLLLRQERRVQDTGQIISYQRKLRIINDEGAKDQPASTPGSIDTAGPCPNKRVAPNDIEEQECPAPALPSPQLPEKA